MFGCNTHLYRERVLCLDWELVTAEVYGEEEVPRETKFVYQREIFDVSYQRGMVLFGTARWVKFPVACFYNVLSFYFL